MSSETEPRTVPAVKKSPEWWRKYGKDRRALLFYIAPKDIAAWFNRGHPRETMVEEARKQGLFERGSHGAWVRPTWRRGRDSFAIWCHLHNVSAVRGFEVQGQEMYKEARLEIERSAAERRPPRRWVAAIVSPAGWGFYEERRLRAGPASASLATMLAAVAREEASLAVVSPSLPDPRHRLDHYLKERGVLCWQELVDPDDVDWIADVLWQMKPARVNREELAELIARYGEHPVYMESLAFSKDWKGAEIWNGSGMFRSYFLRRRST